MPFNDDSSLNGVPPSFLVRLLYPPPLRLRREWCLSLGDPVDGLLSHAAMLLGHIRQAFTPLFVVRQQEPVAKRPLTGAVTVERLGAS